MDMCDLAWFCWVLVFIVAILLLMWAWCGVVACEHNTGCFKSCYKRARGIPGWCSAETKGKGNKRNEGSPFELWLLPIFAHRKLAAARPPMLWSLRPAIIEGERERGREVTSPCNHREGEGERERKGEGATARARRCVCVSCGATCRVARGATGLCRLCVALDRARAQGDGAPTSTGSLTAPAPYPPLPQAQAQTRRWAHCPQRTRRSQPTHATPSRTARGRSGGRARPWARARRP